MRRDGEVGGMVTGVGGGMERWGEWCGGTLGV